MTPLCDNISGCICPLYEIDIVLHFDIDTAYVVKTKTHSNVAGVFYLDNKKISCLPNLNIAILIECKTVVAYCSISC